jgi:hypothetical protein
VSALGLLNFLVLQWFGVRLCRSEVSVLGAGLRDFVGHRMMMTGGFSGEQRKVRIVGADAYGVTARWYETLRWVWPLTGWWSEYRWIARRK